jgi:hypothetical protein
MTNVQYRSEEMHQIAMTIRYDLTAAQAKLTELIRQIAQVEPIAVPQCETCGYRPAQNMPSLAEHAHTVHGGPIPAHWIEDESYERLKAASRARVSQPGEQA